MTDTSDAKRWGPWVAVGQKALYVSHMSTIWRVRRADGSDDATYALKTLRYKKGRSSAAYGRFVREIETLTSRLPHVDSIVRVVDHSTPDEHDESEPFYVMPLAPATLGTAKFLRGQLEQVLKYGVRIAATLGEAHGAGIIHRDIKPANILLFGDTLEPVICDFGICFLEDQDRLTRPEGKTVGTDDFVAPELLGGGQSDQVTAAADVYSLGKTLFACVSGGRVFPREALDDPRFDLAREFGDSRLEHLKGLLERMVTYRREDRLQTMDDVQALLQRAIHNLTTGEPYRLGLYRESATPVELAGSVAQIINGASSVRRTDALRAEIGRAVSAAATIAADFSAANPSLAFFRGRRHDEASAVAARCADMLLSVGLPLVEASEEELFEEWLEKILVPVRSDLAFHYTTERLVLEPAGVLAAFTAAAAAWTLRRMKMVRLVLDEYLRDRSGWLHHQILDNSVSLLTPWIVSAIRESRLVGRRSPELTNSAESVVRMLNGIAVLRFLIDLSPAELQSLSRAMPETGPLPIPFAPGLWDNKWAEDLVQIGSQERTLERQIARDIFNVSPYDFRQACKHLTPALRNAVNYAVSNLDFGRAGWTFAVDQKKWEAWVSSGEE
jgi:hypothetical protein